MNGADDLPASMTVLSTASEDLVKMSKTMFNTICTDGTF